jgi:hypothetical protein
MSEALKNKNIHENCLRCKGCAHASSVDEANDEDVEGVNMCDLEDTISNAGRISISPHKVQSCRRGGAPTISSEVIVSNYMSQREGRSRGKRRSGVKKRLQRWHPRHPPHVRSTRHILW